MDMSTILEDVFGELERAVDDLDDEEYLEALDYLIEDLECRAEAKRSEINERLYVRDNT